jgi:hypothetical protein
MAIDFPNSPAVDDEFTVDERTWIWTGARWDSKQVTSIALNDLSDATITSATNGQLLRYNGTLWVNDNNIDGGSA